MIGNLPVGSLDPGVEYMSAEGHRGGVVQVAPSATPGYWFVTAYGMGAKVVENMKRPVIENALPMAIHCCGFVCGEDPEWKTAPCHPYAKCPDLSTD
jgi:hypothetical protein